MIRKKIILLGAFGVGKSSLLKRYVLDQFSDKYIPTIGVNIKSKNIEVNGQKLSLVIWDIADTVTFDNIPRTYLKGTHGVILVFDLTRPDTLNRLMDDYRGFLSQLPELRTCTVGNKSDLVDSSMIEEYTNSSEVKINYFTSAANGNNVELMFNEFGINLIE